MTFHLTVADGLPPLADALADQLSHPFTDPFAREMVAVPGHGVRSWLTAQLGRRLGISSPGRFDGIVANVEFVFPGTLVRRAIGERGTEGRWSVGPLTWAIYATMQDHGDELDLPVDAVRARAIADLFDRYTLHRPEMVRMWERRLDVDASGSPLPAHMVWQPQLWRRLLERLGSPSDAAALALAATELRLGRIAPQLPERVFLFGLASLPGPHLKVLAALSEQRELHVLAPTPSLPVWHRVHRCAAEPLARPLARTADPTATITQHQLGATWGRQAREAQYVLTAAAAECAATIDVLAAAEVADGSLLAQLQGAIRNDEPAPGAAADFGADTRHLLDPADHSVQWHRCYGPARQADVVRDVLVRLLDERDADGRHRFHPRDIVILCSDVATYAPLAEAVFAGDPGHGVPALPLRVADRSLRQDSPLFDTVAALLDLVGGRFRASDVLAFAAREPVRHRFGFTTDRLGRLAAWADAVHVRWGLDGHHTAQFGLPAEVDAYTWEAAIDQLLLGSAMADAGPRLGLDDTVPFGDVEGDDVDTAGALADLLHHLRCANDRLATTQTVGDWCTALADGAAALCAVPDADAWQWGDLQRELSRFAADAENAGGQHLSVPASELTALFATRLSGRPGRIAFGTGAITLSSLTAQRGVPHPVVCLLGLDGDLGVGTGVLADDLTLTSPCVGDRDERAELRAQLLDVLLAAGERLIVCTTGRDIRTNAIVPAAVPVAELTDLIDASARSADGRRASESIGIDHPRQAWSERNFAPDALGVDGPWSFDAGALAAAHSRRGQSDAPMFLAGPLPAEKPADVALDDLVGAVKCPSKILLNGRLGVWLDGGTDARDDLVPLAQGALDKWKLTDDLLGARIAAGDDWSDDADASWQRVQRASGAVPPLTFGDTALVTVTELVEAMVDDFARCTAHLGDVTVATIPIDVDLGDGRRLTGGVANAIGPIVVELTASKVGPQHELTAWVRLAALTLMRPEIPWEACIIGRDKKGEAPAVVHLRLGAPSDARPAMDMIVDMHDRARRAVVPFLPTISYALFTKGRNAAASAAQTGYGDLGDRWVSFALGAVELSDLLREPPHADEHDGWSLHPSRVERWAHRVWGTFAATTARAGDEGGADDGS